MLGEVKSERVTLLSPSVLLSDTCEIVTINSPAILIFNGSTLLVSSPLSLGYAHSLPNRDNDRDSSYKTGTALDNRA